METGAVSEADAHLLYWMFTLGVTYGLGPPEVSGYLLRDQTWTRQELDRIFVWESQFAECHLDLL